MLTKFIIPYNTQNPPDWQEILTYFRGSELQNYFTKILEDSLKVKMHVSFVNAKSCIQAIIKPQYVDHIPKAVKGIVGDILTAKDEKKEQQRFATDLGKHFFILWFVVLTSLQIF